MKFLALLIFILVAYFSSVLSRQHPVRHAHSRHKRQHLQHDSSHVPGSFIVDGVGGPESGDWSSWSEPSECSRTCGGGVAFQTRHCRDVRSDGSSSCQGGSKRYFSCNIQDCPGGTDFRAEQCAEFNRVPFENRFYDWIPYTKAPNRCELNCMPRGERFYYRHKKKVIDGTRCDEEKLDVCVDGQCLPVGCDMMLGSEAREDNCRECGGDGSSCTRVQGVLENTDLQVGYNDILLIPAGATNIRVQETQPSNNYLAIRNTTGHYYLNGNWRIDFPRDLNFLGTIFHYERRPHGFYAPDTISALGPTSEAIYIVILFQEANPGVIYEYSVPKGIAPQRDPDSYSWVYDDFGECSATCGGGVQTRNVSCVRRRDGMRIPTHLCDTSIQPHTTQVCAPEPCPPQWTTDPWSKCSEPCERGSRERQVYCTQVIASGLPSVANESLCLAIGPKPETKEECKGEVVCPTWHVGPWKPCDKLCGDGKQRRNVRCYKKIDEKIEVLTDSDCPEEKPESEKECMLRPCEGVDWIVSEWSGCDDKCGLTQQTRTVQCSTLSGEVFPNSFCHEYRLPELVKECESPKKCEHEWFAGQWSKCSSKCGSGLQTRKVFCGSLDDEGVIKKVEDEKCDPIEKYEAEQNCTGEEICKGDWFTGPWSPCSKECGGGQMTRKVLCLLNNATVPITNCDGNNVPFSSESCNDNPCGEDEVSAVEPSHDLSEDEDEDCEEGSEEEDEEGELTSVITHKTTLDSGLSSVSEDGATELPGSPKVTSSEATDSSEEAVSSGSTPSSISDITDSESSSSGLSSKAVSTSDSDASDVSSSAESSVHSIVSSTESSGASSPVEDSSPAVTETTEKTETTDSITTIVSILSSLLSSDSTTPTSTDDTTTETTPEPSEQTSSSESTASSSSGDTSAEVSVAETTIGVTVSSVGVGSTTEDWDYIGEVKLRSMERGTTGDGNDTSDMLSDEPSDQTSAATLASDGSSVMEVSTEAGTTGETESASSGASEGSGVLTTEASSAEGSSAASWGTTDVTELWGSSVSSIQLAITKEQKLKKCKKKKKPSCTLSEFGCCFDGKTASEGPFHKGCPQPKTCKESQYGCCSDGVSPAKGKNEKGCPPSQCKETLFGCCQDGVSIAEGNDFEECPEPDILPVSCSTSQYGCCPDKVTPATGPKNQGCFVCEGSGDCDSCNDTKYGCCPDGMRAATGANFTGCEEEGSGDGIIEEDCKKSKYGCCPDGIISADGPNFENCGVIDTENCTLSYFGCCPDGVTTALSGSYEGCRMPCEDEQFGCCPDNVTPAHGNNREGCCLNSLYGCCPDNILEARGPNLEGCGCAYTTYGCCPDNHTVARGSNNEGCGCSHTEHGCCPNQYTPAAGPDFQGCPCYTFQFGCCPDGVTVAKGPHRLGCGCENSEFKCCPDGKTPANGTEFAGCGCAASRFGCCPDGVTDALGEKFEGCKNVPLNPGEACKKDKDRGSCRDFTVKWFFDMEYGGCSRFWYGGCDGNDNRFRNQDECKQVCVAPEGRERCFLPKVRGPCEGYYPKWYYDTERKQCGQFIYGGCLGNNNNFESREECEQLCGTDDRIDVCEQDKEVGPCSGNYTRYYFDKEMRTCVEFEYGGCKANGNNFLTESACTEQCLQPGRSRDHCSLPRDPGSCGERLPRWFFDYAENRCMPFYFTGCGGNKNRFDSIEACEADCPPRIEKDICTLPALVGECHNYTEHWYYDSYGARCKPFYYGGCGGNHNNFPNEQACRQRCEQTSQPPVQVEEFKIEYCFYPDDRGSCSESDPRWFYDSRDGACKQFLYGGCGGNPNRFESRQECEQRCGNAQDACLLPKTVGPCNGNYKQWFYDRQTDSCYEFDYGGCQGNGNRFGTENDCEARCKQAPVAQPTPPPEVHPATRDPYEEQPRPTDICYLEVEAGNCNDHDTAWYFDHRSRRCQAFVYSGCNGNGNRFESEEQCERQCGQFRGQDICNLPQDSGPCRASFRKWYYDTQSAVCREFDYGGCQGSGNRFSSVQECETLCLHREENIPGLDRPGPTQPAICHLPLDSGPCDANYRRWYYNDTSKNCVPMVYGGCGGNLNRFKNFDTCIKFCIVSLRDRAPAPEEQRPAGRDPNEIDVDDCSDAREECLRLQCPYGLERFVDSKNCERCRCNDPCREHYCPESTRCAVEFNKGQDEVQLRPVCRQENKPGQCPSLSTGGTCSQECQSDSDCVDDNKCCPTQCGTTCVPPSRTRYEPQRTEDPPPRPYPVAGAQPPRISGAEPLVSEEEGSHATLRCSVSGNPTPVITWRKGSIIISGTGGRHKFLADGSLQIIGLYHSDAGTYTCNAENGVGHPAQREYRLEIKDPTPRPAEVVGEESTFVVVTLGAPAILQCYAVGWPRPSVTWWRGERMLPLSSQHFEQRRDYSLLIKAVLLRNLGSYTCQAYNGLGKAASWSVTLQAIGPVFSNNPEDTIYNQHLITAPQQPPDTVQRPRPSPRPAPPPPVISLPTVTRPPPPQEPPRVYVVPITVNIPLERTTFAVGSDLSIPCDVDGHPVPRVLWYKDNDVLEPSERVHISESHRLLINRADSSDSGTYRCEAANQYSSATAYTVINVEGVYVHPNCTDNPFFADCKLIVKAKYCTHTYYAKFCCRSCTLAGQLPSYGPHLQDHRAKGRNRRRRDVKLYQLPR